ncbi:tyrosine-protein kinase JAK1-like [Ciona intestinalis]
MELKKYDPSGFPTELNHRNFRLVRIGSFGEVRVCNHSSLGKVALKLFHITESNEGKENTKKMFESEAQVLQQIKHPHIVTFYGVTSLFGREGLVMEFMEGGNLDKLIMSNEVLPWSERLRLLHELASAISYLHNHDKKRAFIHGDIKPQNLLLTKSRVLKLADFGFVNIRKLSDIRMSSYKMHRYARHFGGASTSTFNYPHSTQHTWQFTAPEFLGNLRAEKTSAMDIYSYGIIVYEVLTRIRAYSDSTARKGFILAAVCNGMRPNQSKLNEVQKQLKQLQNHKLFHKLQSLMKECWQQDPTKRPKANQIVEITTQQMEELTIEESDVVKTEQVDEVPAMDVDEVPAIDDPGMELKKYDPSGFPTERNNRNYELVGIGDFGEVRVCSHSSLGRVALKLFRITEGSEAIENTKKKFESEAEVLQQIKHPHIVTFYGVTSLFGRDGLVMEFMEGGNLGELNMSNEVLPWSERLRLLHELASAISYLHNHDKNIIHSDIKPENLLFTKSRVLKLANFGSVNIRKRTGTSTSTFEIPHSRQHTWPYTAPELLENFFTEKTSAMDIYSFGIVVYEVLTRTRAYSDATDRRDIFVAAVCNGMRPNQSKLDEVDKQLKQNQNHKLFHKLQSLMKECWQQEPTKRPKATKIVEITTQQMEELTIEESGMILMIHHGT